MSVEELIKQADAICARYGELEHGVRKEDDEPPDHSNQTIGRWHASL